MEYRFRKGTRDTKDSQYLLLERITPKKAPKLPPAWPSPQCRKSIVLPTSTPGRLLAGTTGWDQNHLKLSWTVSGRKLAPTAVSSLSCSPQSINLLLSYGTKRTTGQRTAYVRAAETIPKATVARANFTLFTRTLRKTIDQSLAASSPPFSTPRA